VVLAMMNLPRYRHQTLADVMHLVVEPMTRDRIAIARAGGEGKVEETAGIAIWASVSDEVDAKIREQIQARVFPLRLKAEDWNSGETTWLLDVIAPSQKVATSRAGELQAGGEGQADPHPSARQPAGRSGGAGEDEGAAGGRGGGRCREKLKVGIGKRHAGRNQRTDLPEKHNAPRLSSHQQSPDRRRYGIHYLPVV
jgi:hemolysin-activating ACP:hemolysin acyltransferase